MGKIDELRGLESVHKIKAIEPTYEVRGVQKDITYLKRKKLSLQQKAAVTGHWGYYQELLSVQEALRCRQEILEKWPNEKGKSFPELLAEEVKKINF